MVKHLKKKTELQGFENFVGKYLPNKPCGPKLTFFFDKFL